uniref:F-box/LRR-repeat protein 15/At3g58940/PEG3-like LRR domain-containing protein n=1 Tax=Aegilops tauschii TaxID=37682 RepID=M8AQQ4_AEGTA
MAAGDSANVSNAMSDAFLSAAETALAVFRGHRGGPLSPGTRFKRLTFRLDYDAYRRAKPYWILKDDNYSEEPDSERVDGLALAHPAASKREELHLECRRYSYEHRPRLESLPCAATLRLLELTHCKLDPPSAWPARSAVLALPRLTDLQLRDCVLSEGYLQVMLHAAPALTSLVLVNVKRKTVKKADPNDSFGRPFHLRCPTLTALELDTSGLYYSDSETQEELKVLVNRGIELDMPSLRSFCYRGFSVKLSLTSPAPGLARVELDVSRYGQGREPPSRMLRSFSTTRALKLCLGSIKDIVAGEEEEGGPILPTFPNLELLEVDGSYQYKKNDTAALGMARLLGSCPVMSELWLRLSHIRYKACKKDPVGASFAATVDRFSKLAASMASVSEETATASEILATSQSSPP